jgi:phosphoglycerol geranylgeranyltransferase
MVADRYLDSPVVYVEHSGSFGGHEAEAVLAAVSDAVSGPRLWYGGGLASRTDVRRMLDAGADAVVVGNVFHEIAREEASLFDRADGTLPADASRARVEAWLAAEVDVAETAAAAYLSTVPTCARPTATATTLLVDTLVAWLRLRTASSVETALTALVGTAAVEDADADSDRIQWARAALDAVRAEETPLAARLSPAGAPPDDADTVSGW